jgi:histidine triad (HIT) family protein
MNKPVTTRHGPAAATDPDDPMMHDPNCIFCRIVAGQIPSRSVFEDDELVVIHDINPAAPVHLLLVPKTHFASLDQAEPQHQQLLGKMLLLAPRLARENGALNGFRLVLGGPPPWKHPG